MKRLEKVFFLCFCVGVTFIFATNLWSQSADTTNNTQNKGEYKSANENLSDEEFRRGVQSFYRGSYNDAILLFEKALAYLPQNNLTLDWMARSYYYSGLEAAAIQTWERLVSSGYGGLLLPNRLSIVKERRVFLTEDTKSIQYTDAGSFYGVYNDNFIFAGPTCILPLTDGSAWVTAYASNQLLKIDVNGYVLERISGPLNGFDHPLDIIALKNGDLLISETAGDRLSLLTSKGKFKKYIGSKGIALGQLSGPCYLAQDSHENIFVTDYGNKRVDVFDKDGNPLFNFGQPSLQNSLQQEYSAFSGLKGPTGIAIMDDRVYVACDVSGCIYQFDTAGNFIKEIVEPKTFNKVESIKPLNESENLLMVSAKNKVFCLDVDNGQVAQSAFTGNGPGRLTSAVKDANGNLMVADYKANEIYVMARMQDIVGGLFVQIEKVNASKFPKVTLNVKVENRYRSPIVGLKEKNFFLTEDAYPVSNLKLLGSGNELDCADITLLIDRSSLSKDFCTNGALENAVRTIAKSMNGKGTMRIVCAGNLPITEYVGNPKNCEIFDASGLRTPFSDKVSLDAAFRLCANDLINGLSKKCIVILSGGYTPTDAFTKYSTNQTSTYLNNNGILCYAVSDNQRLSEDFDYIVKNTRGHSYFVWQSQGIDSLVSDIIATPCGEYTFEYTSLNVTSLETKYFPIKVETYLLNRSGTDELGFFTPYDNSPVKKEL